MKNPNAPVTRKDMQQMTEPMKKAPRTNAGITGAGGKNVAPLYKATTNGPEKLPRKIAGSTKGQFAK